MFKDDKSNSLKKLDYAIKNKLADEAVLPFLKIINNTDFFYTTSSCYGRITIDKSDLAINKKTHEWIAKYHRCIKDSELSDALNKDSSDVVWVRNLPFIMHVCTKDIDSAEKFLKLTKTQGLKRCGIMQLKPRIFVELRGEDVVEIPAKYKNKFLINKDETEKITEILNHSFLKNKERLEKLFREFEIIFA
ncbi:MAG: hypothetical protein KAQ92_07510 [Candidatus Aenigmarchaeota archaeon]|nr:hypothetical protein [Candidatus Aenigmarchaeota archaeon]